MLLVTGKDPVKARMDNYYFLSYALGASTVERVEDVDDPRVQEYAATSHPTNAASNPFVWDWVIADSETLDEVTEILFDKTNLVANTTSKLSKKRKRTAHTTLPILRKGIVGGREVRIASDDFVKQSLILGILLEE